MAYRATRIKPGHDRLRHREPALRESHHGFAGWRRTISINREESHIQHCSISVEDTHLVMLGNIVWQHKPVGSRRQHLSGNLNRLAKSDFHGLILLICSCNRQHDRERKQKTENAKRLFNIHLFLLTMSDYLLARFIPGIQVAENCEEWSSVRPRRCVPDVISPDP